MIPLCYDSNMNANENYCRRCRNSAADLGLSNEAVRLLDATELCPCCLPIELAELREAANAAVNDFTSLLMSAYLSGVKA